MLINVSWNHSVDISVLYGKTLWYLLIAHQNNTLLHSKPYKCFNSRFLIDILFTLRVKITIKGFKKWHFKTTTLKVKSKRCYINRCRTDGKLVHWHRQCKMPQGFNSLDSCKDTPHRPVRCHHIHTFFSGKYPLASVLICSKRKTEMT